MENANEPSPILESVRSEEYLDGMTQFRPIAPEGHFHILVAVVLEKGTGNPYFKIYDNPKYSDATKVARISFISPRLITGHVEIGGKAEWHVDEIGSETKKELVNYLSSQSKLNPKYTVWTMMRFAWNESKNISMDSIDEYATGEYDDANQSNPDYIPFKMGIPNYLNLK